MLIIVESPSKCKIIESYLGEKYTCIATCGHIREIKDLKSITRETLLPTYSLLTNKYISALKKEIKKHKEIIIATDNDREGEAIAWHICDVFHLPLNTPRIVFNEITEDCIIRAVKTPTTIDMKLVRAQQSRQVLDIFLGYKISPLLWKHISRNSEKSLSAGRCQTPALRIIYENHKSKQEQKITFSVKGYFTSKNIPFESVIEEDSIQEFLTRCAGFSFSLSKKYTRVTCKIPPEPFTTSKILQLSFSAKEIMQCCCKLYEKGYITYPRTSSTFYAETFLRTAQEFICKEYGEKYVHPNLMTLVQTTHPHEAIRPTNIYLRRLIGDVTPKENRIYEIIWKNTVQSCISDAVVHSFECHLSPPEPFETPLVHTSELLAFDGWQIVNSKKTEDTTFHFLKNIPSDTLIRCKRMVSDFHVEYSNSRYSEASLIRKLESLGIGRPSTFASLVSIIQDRNYVVKKDTEGEEIEKTIYEYDESLKSKLCKKLTGFEKNKLHITHTGIIVMEFLLKHFGSLFDYRYTQVLEDRLEDSYELDKLCHEYVDNIERHISSMDVKGKEEIKIDEENTLIIGRNGSVIVNDSKFIKVKQDIDLDKLRDGEYKIEDIQDLSNTFYKGVFMDEKIFIKNGRYGIYTSWRNKNISLHYYKKVPIEKITLENVIWAIHQNARKFNFTEIL